MAEVDCQLLATSKGEETDWQVIDTEARIKQVGGVTVEAMHEHSPEAWSGSSITEIDTEEHDVLHRPCYSWLGRVNQKNIRQNSSRWCAQASKRIVESALKRPMGVNILQG